MVHGENSIPYWIDRSLTGLAGPNYDASISIGLPFEPEDSQYGKYQLEVSEETVRRNIRSRRLKALRRGTQWFIPHDVLVIFANSYDTKTGQIRQLL